MMNTATATWDDTIPANTAISVGLPGNAGGIVGVVVNAPSTISAGEVVFEASVDDTNWGEFDLTTNAGARIAGATFSSAAVSECYSNVSQNLPMSGFRYFRVRLATALTGTGSISVQIQGVSTTVGGTSIY